MLEIINGYIEDFGTFQRTHLWLRGWQRNAFTFSASSTHFIHGATGEETELTFDAILPIATLDPSSDNLSVPKG